MSALKWQSDYGPVGRVFIRNKESGEKLRLESAYFSNLDYRWHDIEGNVHPMYEKYLGKPYSVQFRIQNSDGKGNLEPFEGELKLSYKIGERGHVTPEIVAEGKISMTKGLNQLHEKWGLQELVKSEWLEKMKSHLVISFFNPGMTIERNISVTAFLPLWFFLDMLEGLNLPFKEMVKYVDIIQPVIYLEKDPIIPEDDPIAITANKLANIFADATSRRRSLEEVRPALDAMIECFEAVCIKMSTEWKEMCSTNPERKMNVQKHLREITVAAVIAVELSMFDLGYSVSKKVRSCFWYKMVMKSVIASASNVNDILSYQMEAVSNTLNNNVVYCYMKSGDSLNEAMKKAMDLSNSSMDDIDYFGGLLLDQFRGTEDYVDVEKFVNVGRGLADSHIQAYPSMARYHKDLVYDCIVDEISSSPA